MPRQGCVPGLYRLFWGTLLLNCLSVAALRVSWQDAGAANARWQVAAGLGASLEALLLPVLFSLATVSFCISWYHPDRRHEILAVSLVCAAHLVLGWYSL